MMAYPPGFCDTMISHSQSAERGKTHRQRMNLVLMPLLTLPHRSEIKHWHSFELAHTILHRSNLLRPLVGEEIKCSLSVFSLVSPLAIITRRICSVMAYAMQLPEPEGCIGVDLSNSANHIATRLVSPRMHRCDTRELTSYAPSTSPSASPTTDTPSTDLRIYPVGRRERDPTTRCAAR